MTINPDNYRIPDAPAKAVPHGTVIPPFVSDVEYREILLKMLQANASDPAQQFSISQLEAEVTDQGLRLPIVRRAGHDVECAHPDPESAPVVDSQWAGKPIRHGE